MTGNHPHPLIGGEQRPYPSVVAPATPGQPDHACRQQEKHHQTHRQSGTKSRRHTCSDNSPSQNPLAGQGGCRSPQKAVDVGQGDPSPIRVQARQGRMHASIRQSQRPNADKIVDMHSDILRHAHKTFDAGRAPAEQMGPPTIGKRPHRRHDAPLMQDADHALPRGDRLQRFAVTGREGRAPLNEADVCAHGPAVRILTADRHEPTSFPSSERLLRTEEPDPWLSGLSNVKGGAG